jgi:hypothetical protein
VVTVAAATEVAAAIDAVRSPGKIKILIYRNSSF